MVDYTGVIFTIDEIRQKIEGLSEPGSTVFFYLSGGPTSGGPLGRGAAIIELNPGYPGKGQKKYNVYTALVDEKLALGKRSLLWKSDKAEQIAGWVKDRNQTAEQLKVGVKNQG